jgi:uncharacterized protein
MNELKVKLEQLVKADEITKFIEHYCCYDMPNSILDQNFKLLFSLKKMGDEILLMGEIKGFVMMECCRCLKNFECPIQATFAQAYPVNTDEIDVDKEARESVILNIPLKPLCNIDCLGLCQICGKDRNLNKCNCADSKSVTDSRWNKLKSFLK